MYCKDATAPSLTQVEQTVLRCLRTAFARPLANAATHYRDATETQLTACFADLFARLRRLDPYILRVGSPDTRPTVFELQLVHLVNLARFRDCKAKNAVVRWLFPEDEVLAAKLLVGTLGHLAAQLARNERNDEAASLLLRERMVALIVHRARHVR